MTNNIAATQDQRPLREQGRVQPKEQNERRGWMQPVVNIVERSDGYVLEAEMPGVNKNGLEVLLEGNELTIVGRRGSYPENADCVYRESQDRDYRRTFELEPTIDTTRISARMDNGVLLLDLPKAERVKPRKIAVE